MNPQLLKKAQEKHHLAEKLFFTEEDIRWATPEIVADYRAERLKCKIIADLGCGIGFQTFAFAKTCQKIYAVEIDERKLELAKKNAQILGLKNIVFICGDALDSKVVNQIKEVEIIFCDPERLAGEEERKIETIQPDIKKLLEIYSKVTDKMALEFPPQIKKIDFGGNFDCEKEYLSLNGNLNRLNLYFGKLKKAGFSAVILPGKAVLNGDGNLKIKADGKLKKYLYEINPAVTKASLIPELLSQTKAVFCHQNKSSFLASDQKIKSPFFRNSYETVSSGDFEDKEIIGVLEENNFGKAIIRFEVDPKDYWKIRNSYEQNLSGTETAHLFRFGSRMIIAKPL